MRSDMKSTRNEISTHHKRNSVYITFQCGRNEMKFRFDGGTRKTTHSVKTNRFCFDDINVCADIFDMISFRVVFT